MQTSADSDKLEMSKIGLIIGPTGQQVDHYAVYQSPKILNSHHS